jgi:hypothetical protein
LRSQTPSAGRQFAAKQNSPRSGRFAKKTDKLSNSNGLETAQPARRHTFTTTAGLIPRRNDSFTSNNSNPNRGAPASLLLTNRFHTHDRHHSHSNVRQLHRRQPR